MWDDLNNIYDNKKLITSKEQHKDFLKIFVSSFLSIAIIAIQTNRMVISFVFTLSL